MPQRIAISSGLSALFDKLDRNRNITWPVREIVYWQLLSSRDLMTYKQYSPPAGAQCPNNRETRAAGCAYPSRPASGSNNPLIPPETRHIRPDMERPAASQKRDRNPIIRKLAMSRIHLKSHSVALWLSMAVAAAGAVNVGCSSSTDSDTGAAGAGDSTNGGAGKAGSGDSGGETSTGSEAGAAGTVTEVPS